MLASNRRAVCIVALLFVMSLPLSLAAEEHQTPHPTPTCNAQRTAWTVGLLACTEEASTDGYTLFAPMPSNTTYLIDSEGRYLHSWTSPGEHRPGLSAYLLEDGDLLRAANIAQTAGGNFSGGGTAGKVERISWNGTLEWSWEYSSENYISHHDIEPMPNGNLLMIAWEDRSEAEAIQAGRNPAIASDSPGGQNNVWPDHIIEVEPVGNQSANIVWEWYAWDHLIQDFDETKDNYGVVSDHPERLNINYVGATGNQAGRADWMHCNGIDYHPILDQIALSCKGMNEVYIIDHSTTTEEAAGSTGGNSGQGGDILYRWGNPQVYGKGLSSDQQLFGQHDVQWIPEGHEHAGQLMVFNNGNGRAVPYSSVEILETGNINGTYSLLSNGTFGPLQPTWTWDQGETMYSGAVSGAQPLPNGNTLVTHGTKGTLFEISADGDIVWHYISPIGAQGAFNQSEPVPAGNWAGATANPIFKATHYPIDHAAFAGRELNPTAYLEHWTDQCPDEAAWGWDSDGDGCIDDTDGDGVHDPLDICAEGDDGTDLDNDSVPDDCDPFVDSDNDGVEDSQDLCQGHNDSLDQDQDGIPEPCDSFLDSDGDGVQDDVDQCAGHDDDVDVDQDGIPDACDSLLDQDGDGFPDDEDACPGGDDLMDDDMDGVPDECDDTPFKANSTEETDSGANDLNNDSDTDTPSLLASSTSRTRFVFAAALGSIGLVLIGLALIRQKSL